MKAAKRGRGNSGVGGNGRKSSTGERVSTHRGHAGLSGSNPPSGRRISKLVSLLALALLTASVLGVAGASAVAPILTIDPTPTASYTTAQVSGTVDPGDTETSVYIEYSKEPVSEGWQSSFVQAVPAGAGSTPVSGELTGLKPGTEYFIRLGAENGVEPEVFSPEPNPTVTTEPVTPATVSIDPVTTFTGTTAHFSGTINPGAPAGNPEAFNVRWFFQCEPECPGLEGQIVADNSGHQVDAEATGLLPNTVYEVSLVEENAGGTESTSSEIFRTAAPAPAASTLPAFAIEGGTKALVAGRVNPENSETTYWFEYGPTSGYGQSLPLTQDAEAGSGHEVVIVTQELARLAAAKTYHFRIVAENAVGRTPGEDLVFTTALSHDASSAESCPNEAIRLLQGSTRLPECRAYEMVSPVDKNGNDAQVAPQGSLASLDGNAVTFESWGAFAGAEGSDGPQVYLSRRSASGWNTRGLSPVSLAKSDQSFVNGFSDDLSQTLMSNGNPVLAPGATPGSRNAYLRNNLTNTYTLVAPATPDNIATNPNVGDVRFADATPGFMQFIFQSNDQLTPDAAPGVENLYEWDNGAVSLVGVLPGSEGGGAPSGGSSAGPPPGTTTAPSYVEDTISEDGSRIFFSDIGTRQLYVREEGSTTVHVSASQRATPDPASPQPAIWLAASSDGSLVYFSSTEKLTNNSNAGFSAASGTDLSDLYRFNVDTGRLDDVSAGPSGAGFLGVAGASADGSYLYFVATADLARGATSGAPNVYLLHDDDLRLVTTLGNGPSEDLNWVSDDFIGGAPKAARVSPDGRTALFTSSAQLTGYDNAGHSELYRYDASKASLACISCSPTGFIAGGNAAINLAYGNIVDLTRNATLSRSLSVTGERVVFTSQDALVPADSNGTVDVYEWDGPNESSCHQPSGCVYLISSGQSMSDDAFAEASPNGSDVFFGTRQRLVKQDQDAGYDIYDARVNGGLEAQNVGATKANCVGDGCRGQLVPASTSSTPASSVIAGPPNTHKHKKHKHKKHKHKKHQKKHKKGHHKSNRAAHKHGGAK